MCFSVVLLYLAQYSPLSCSVIFIHTFPFFFSPLSPSLPPPMCVFLYYFISLFCSPFSLSFPLPFYFLSLTPCSSLPFSSFPSTFSFSLLPLSLHLSLSHRIRECQVYDDFLLSRSCLKIGFENSFFHLIYFRIWPINLMSILMVCFNIFYMKMKNYFDNSI